MKKYNRSEIFRRMWEWLDQWIGMDKSTALRKAWAEAKANQELEAKAKEYAEYYRLKKELEDKLNALKEEIVKDMAGQDVATVGGYTIKYSENIRKITDTARLKSELPDIYNEYRKDSRVTTLTVSA